MKEVKREVKREVVDTIIEYYAYDGTKFNSEKECKKYESTAACLVNYKVKDCKVGESDDAWKLMGGYEDHSIVAFKPNCESDVDALCQLILINSPWLSEGTQGALRDTYFKTIEDAYKNGDVVLFGVNCDGDYYFINSRQNIIDNLMKLDKEEVNDVK